MLKIFLKQIIKKLRFTRQTVFLKGALTGHFYSPIPNLGVVRQREQQIFGETPRTLPGLDLNEEEQLRLLGQLQEFYDDQPFTASPGNGLRYFFENAAFRYSDAIFLHCLIRKIRPKRIVEVGSGYSSCVTLDTNALYFENSIDCTFIEPHSTLLRQLAGSQNQQNLRILERPLEIVPVEEFSRLSSGDFLFIDSTHVAKVGSDVNYLFAVVLPALQPGVYIHFHDIFYPFEYPKQWV